MGVKDEQKRSILNIEISEFYPKKPGFYRYTELVKRIDSRLRKSAIRGVTFTKEALSLG